MDDILSSLDNENLVNFIQDTGNDQAAEIIKRKKIDGQQLMDLRERAAFSATLKKLTQQQKTILLDCIAQNTLCTDTITFEDELGEVLKTRRQITQEDNPPSVTPRGLNSNQTKTHPPKEDNLKSRTCKVVPIPQHTEPETIMPPSVKLYNAKTTSKKYNIYKPKYYKFTQSRNISNFQSIPEVDIPLTNVRLESHKNTNVKDNSTTTARIPEDPTGHLAVCASATNYISHPVSLPQRNNATVEGIKKHVQPIEPARDSNHRNSYISVILPIETYNLNNTIEQNINNNSTLNGNKMESCCKCILCSYSCFLGCKRS